MNIQVIRKSRNDHPEISLKGWAIKFDSLEICALDAYDKYISIYWDGVEKTAKDSMSFIKSVLLTQKFNKINMSVYYKKDSSKKFTRIEMDVNSISYKHVAQYNNIHFLRVNTGIIGILMDTITPDFLHHPHIGVMFSYPDNNQILGIIAKLFQFNNRYGLIKNKEELKQFTFFLQVNLTMKNLR